MSKGIRVNQLAKELGVESKSILTKCREEGLGDKVPNHMSVLSIGLAETVREWFSGNAGGVATAVETAAPVDVLTKPRTLRKVVNKTADGTDEPTEHAEHTDPADGADSVNGTVTNGNGVAVHHTVTTPAVAPTAPIEPVQVPVSETVIHPGPVDVAPPAVVEEPPTVAPVAEVPAPVAPSTPPALVVVPPTAPRMMTGSNLNRPTGMPAEAPLRPTISLSSPRPMAPKAAAPKFVPKAAVIQGPNIVRVEQPEHVAPLRRPGPRPIGGGGPNDIASFIQARPKQGGGVIRVEEDEEEAKKKAAAAKKGSLSTRRKGLDGRRGEATEKLREFTEADLIARRDALNAAASTRPASTGISSRCRAGASTPSPRPTSRRANRSRSRPRSPSGRWPRPWASRPTT